MQLTNIIRQFHRQSFITYKASKSLAKFSLKMSSSPKTIFEGMTTPAVQDAPYIIKTESVLENNIVDTNEISSTIKFLVSSEDVHNNESSSSSDVVDAREIGNIAIYWHPACYEHCIPGHPEQPDRVKEILRALKAAFPSECFRLSPKVTEEQILLFHKRSHLQNFNIRADKAERSKSEGRTAYYEYDSDTAVMWATREAAFHAAGAVIAAVDAIYAPDNSPDKARTAFCAVRPPGHHAETNTVMGFCFFNNAGIAAKWAQLKYRESHGVVKVAVLDFDVHHGNGTEEGFRNDETLFYGSTHEKDNFPGTGRDLYPNIGDNAKSEAHRRIVNRYLEGGDHKRSRKQFYSRWLHVVDEMERFKPDLIIISAGFDAHGDDPLGNCWLQDEDFAWATDVISRAASRIKLNSTPVPIISVLEGGYDLNAIARSAVVHCKALERGYVAPNVGDEATALAESIEKLEL